MPRPSQALLTRERIVAVATALLDAEGLAALSTRRLAAALGVRAPSLYNHFRTKDEILEAVADGISGEVDAAAFTGLVWSRALLAWARAYRAAIVAHPNAIPLLAHGPDSRPHALRTADAIHGTLVGAGWPPGHATRIGAAVRYLVIGSAVGSFAAGFPADPAVYAERFPHLHDAHRLAGQRERVDSGAFEFALTALVDGLVALYPTVARTPAVPGPLGQRRRGAGG